MRTDLDEAVSIARDLVSDAYQQASALLNEPLNGVPDVAAEAAFELNYSCAVTSESALLLLKHMNVWDADILARSVVEGTLKYLYLLIGSEEQMRLRASEFFDMVPGCQSLSRLAKATKLLRAVEDPGARQWAAIREVVEIDTPVTEQMRGVTSVARKDVQRRWSFTGLVEAIAKEPGLEPIAVLGYTYGMQSHLVHKDSNATGMMYERQERDSVRRDAAMLAHGARIVSDLADMTNARVTLAAAVSAAESPSLSRLGVLTQQLQRVTKVFELHFLEVEYPDQAHA